MEITAPSSASAYYYGACLDAVADESDTTNNCSTSATVTVQDVVPPPGDPDLSVALPSVSDGRPAAGALAPQSASLPTQALSSRVPGASRRALPVYGAGPYSGPGSPLGFFK